MPLNKCYPRFHRNRSVLHKVRYVVLPLWLCRLRDKAWLSSEGTRPEQTAEFKRLDRRIAGLEDVLRTMMAEWNAREGWIAPETWARARALLSEEHASSSDTEK